MSALASSEFAAPIVIDVDAPFIAAASTGAAFPRAARLLRPEDFVRALKTRAQRGRFIWVYRRAEVGSATQAPRPRLGLMIGKKNARTAVLRNAIKRRIREQFRLRQTALPASQYVVRLSIAITTRDVGAVIAEWTGALERDIAKLAAAKSIRVAAPIATTSPGVNA